MKRKIFIILLWSFAFTAHSFADSFTDAIQDLAVAIACKGTYAGAEAGYDEDPEDYYTPNMMASRFAEESGNKTMTATFYGVCFNYAQFAFTEIKNYKSWYNKQGMYESQFWLAGVHDNPNQIELMGIGTKNDYSRLQNGEYIKTYNTSLRSVKTHNGASNHAWLWIERADGVWFWVDPTWTDTGGYVVYGYVKNGQEIQCRPDEKYCEIYPNFLNNLPSPPPMGQRLAPSKTANSTNRQETILDAGTDWIVGVVDKALRKTFIDVDYKMKNQYLAFLASVDIPFTVITDKAISAGKMGFSLEMAPLYNNIAMFWGLEYLHNLENNNNLHSAILELNLCRRLFNNLAWYIGGGIGLQFDFSNTKALPRGGNGIVDTGYFAWKVDTGLIINLSKFFTKLEVSYNNVIGFSMGAGLGFGFDF
ncbi:hypothetical protein [Treponema sp.]|uniref:hypothetical protein n=1 Tax=Treponema sp. TaxID=166 RepID=UPI00298D63BE|nr:hypothetical protein [Treponema sp.]MCR5613777.1 hypothetical protein [Treponema sp.]